MKTLLKIFLLSSILCACNNSSQNKDVNEADTMNSVLVPDSSLNNPDRNERMATPLDLEREKRLQATSSLLSSKQEINLLRSEVSDSLSKTGLSTQRRLLFVKTIQQLEISSDLVNKQLEQILVSDLQNSREKLNGIVKKMQESERELSAMIARIDKISSYLQVAADLIQSLSPVKPIPPKSNGAKK